MELPQQNDRQDDGQEQPEHSLLAELCSDGVRLTQQAVRGADEERRSSQCHEQSE
jgi:hypothetical protein